MSIFLAAMSSSRSDVVTKCVCVFVRSSLFFPLVFLESVVYFKSHKVYVMCLQGVCSARCLQGIRKVSVRYLGAVWEVSGMYLEGVLKMFGRCLECVFGVTRGCLEGV